MLAAVESGNAKKVAELIREDPGFKVNMDQDRERRTLLHSACNEDSRSAVIPLLLAHPDIDVNVKDIYGITPFLRACLNGSTSCVRLLLKDPRVKVNEPDQGGRTPLWRAAFFGYLDIIKWWIASGREMDLGEPGGKKMDIIGVARKKGKAEVVTLLERFQKNPEETRYSVRVELGFLDALAAEMFAMVVFVSDGLLQVKKRVNTKSNAARFFRIASRLPLELQMMLCFRQVGSCKEIIPGKEREVAFKELARKL